MLLEIEILDISMNGIYKFKMSLSSSGAPYFTIFSLLLLESIIFYEVKNVKFLLNYLLKKCYKIKFRWLFQMVQATIILEDMIKTEHLRNDWWYWSSLSAAAKISTLSSLALRIYSLDAAIIYEKIPSSLEQIDNLETSSLPDPNALPSLDLSEKSKVSRKSNKKRKEPEG